MYIFDISIYGLNISPTWYGLSYALGFVICYFFVKRYFSFRDRDHIDTLLSYIFVGVILGGRVGYIILYNFTYFLEHPMSIFRIWEGGMSFHGGFLGVVLAVLVFAYRYRYQFWSLIDTLAVIIPVAIGLGRVGNWINQELPGYTPYDGVFPMMIGGVSHFPSPILEMLLEGIGLFIVMNIGWRFFSKNISKRISQKQEIRGRKIFSIGASGSGGIPQGYFQCDRVTKEHGEINFYNNEFRRFSEIPGFLSGLFLIGYSIARLIAEQYRLPDVHIGYILGTDWMTLGIVYTIPMIGYGVYLLYTSTRSRHGSI